MMMMAKKKPKTTRPSVAQLYQLKTVQRNGRAFSGRTQLLQVDEDDNAHATEEATEEAIGNATNNAAEETTDSATQTSTFELNDLESRKKVAKKMLDAFSIFGASTDPSDDDLRLLPASSKGKANRKRIGPQGIQEGISPIRSEQDNIDELERATEDARNRLIASKIFVIWRAKSEARKRKSGPSNSASKSGTSNNSNTNAPNSATSSTPQQPNPKSQLPRSRHHRPSVFQQRVKSRPVFNFHRPVAGNQDAPRNTSAAKGNAAKPNLQSNHKPNHRLNMARKPECGRPSVIITSETEAHGNAAWLDSNAHYGSNKNGTSNNATTTATTATTATTTTTTTTDHNQMTDSASLTADEDHSKPPRKMPESRRRVPHKLLQRHTNSNMSENSIYSNGSNSSNNGLNQDGGAKKQHQSRLVKRPSSIESDGKRQRLTAQTQTQYQNQNQNPNQAPQPCSHLCQQSQHELRSRPPPGSSTEALMAMAESFSETSESQSLTEPCLTDCSSSPLSGANESAETYTSPQWQRQPHHPSQWAPQKASSLVRQSSVKHNATGDEDNADTKNIGNNNTRKEHDSKNKNNKSKKKKKKNEGNNRGRSFWRSSRRASRQASRLRKHPSSHSHSRSAAIRHRHVNPHKASPNSQLTVVSSPRPLERRPSWSHKSVSLIKAVFSRPGKNNRSDVARI